MKSFLTTFLFIVCSLGLRHSSLAQTAVKSPIEDVVNAVKNNRVTDMAVYFDNIVPITINNSQTAYSKHQAEMVLKDFFTRNEPKDVKVMDNGSPTSTSKFAICVLSSSTGKFDMYILMKQKDPKDTNSYVLQEIRIAKE